MPLSPFDFDKNRRLLLKQLGLVPLLLRPSPLHGLTLWRDALSPADASTPWLNGTRYTPHYPVSSPLEDVLRHVTPGLDEFVTERYAFEIGSILDGWASLLKRGGAGRLEPYVADSVLACSLKPSHKAVLRHAHGVECIERTFSPDPHPGMRLFLNGFDEWLGPGSGVDHAEFEITSIEADGKSPLTVQSSVRFSVVFQHNEGRREQRIGTWQIEWQRNAAQEPTAVWKVSRFLATKETCAVVQGAGFVDVTTEAMASNESYRRQLHQGSDYWRSVLDGACGIDVYGNNGVAAGDYNNDGFDDLYVSQPAGLPNRLYRNRGDGTFEDVTEKADVGVLDNTACALFADFRNIGLQDLLVVCGSGPLLFLNDGKGAFTLKRDAFQFAKPPQGTFTHAAIADYDGDGRLDIYFCLYSYYLGLDQYHYPTPYFDARNGPPNFLFHNQGDGTFVDRTEAAGLGAENDRYSFACAWGDIKDNTLPDLYVVNDFGRNNLYRSHGDGTFGAVSAEANVQDVGAGMSACWGDSSNNGRQDLYVANMWSAAGQRVSQQQAFHPKSTKETHDLYRRHARGNALYRNHGDGTFENVSDAAGVEMGRWAWCSDFFDFDHDGHEDLYVTNGYVTAQQDASDPSKPIDLGSFFWRQVVARSPDDATPSLAYERGWNALNELIRSGHSWSGHERNVLLASNGNGSFCEVSGALGLDLLEDGRSFALADLDGDGRLEVVVKNRNGPQLRIMRNALEDIGDSIAFCLRGTKSNRDAIGASITLKTGELSQRKFLQAGSGFLAQHSKVLFFGVGKATGPVQASIHWPSGLTQQFTGLPRNSRIDLVEGRDTFVAKPFQARAQRRSQSAAPEQSPDRDRAPASIDTWLIDPLKAPRFTLPDRSGKPLALEAYRGRVVLLHLWSAEAPGFELQLKALDRRAKELASNNVCVIAVRLDSVRATARDHEATQQGLSYTVLLATDDVAGIYNLIYRYLFDRRANLAPPTSFLVDRSGMIVKVYQGPIGVEALLEDARSIPETRAERIRRALPFPGTLYQGDFVRNDFTYGVAMFQHGYFDQASESFEQVIATRPDDAEAHYNLGTLNLRRGSLSEAQRQLERTVALKPAYPEAWNNLGMIAARQGHTDEAVRNFQQSLTLRPAYTTALLNLGNLYRHENAYTEAGRYLKRALDLQPDDPEANYSLGMLYAQQDQLDASSDYLRRAVELRPGYPEALNNLGVLYVREQKVADAEKEFLTCIERVPSFEGSYLNLARLYVSRNEKAKAREAIEGLLRLNPESTTGKQALQALGRDN